MQSFEQFALHFGELIWSMPLFVLLLGCGVTFSVFTKFVQYRVMTHGISVIRGKYDKPGDPGQINHFQALCAALSATIGLGNIAGVAIAVQLGGPGAIFWMWVVGFFGMAIKFVECGLATMFRDEKDVPDPGAPALTERDSEERTLEYQGEAPPEPGSVPRGRGEVSGGPMWYIRKGLAEPAEKRGNKVLFGLLKAFAVLYAFVTFIAAFGGGNSYQSWNVANMMETQYQINPALTGAVLAFLVAMVTIGGIKRIGNVASKLVPGMCVIYVAGALYIIALNGSQIPAVLSLIVTKAFSPAESGGAFLGAGVMVAFTWGLRRALFSNEAGQGSAAIAHAAAKTNEPIREGVVAGIGPFVDTLIICTMTAMVILFSDAHRREPVGAVAQVDGERIIVSINNDLPQRIHQVSKAEIMVGREITVWKMVEQKQGGEPEQVTVKVVEVADDHSDNWLGSSRLTARIPDSVEPEEAKKQLAAIETGAPVHLKLDGASLTRFAFDIGWFGFGKWMVTLGVILFAFSTMISWSYYGEKGAEYLFGPSFVLPYKFMFVTVIFLACIVKEFSIVYNMGDALAGAQVLVNLPATLLLFPVYLRATRSYFRRLDSGEMKRTR